MLIIITLISIDLINYIQLCLLNLVYHQIHGYLLVVFNFQELVLLWDDWWRKHEARWASRHARAKSTNDLESVKVSTIAQGDIVRTRQVLQDF